jgi:hypothetical protein
LLGKCHCLSWGHYSKLLSVVVNDTDLRHTNIVVDTGTFTFNASISYVVIVFC